jgi:hypothetical protein
MSKAPPRSFRLVLAIAVAVAGCGSRRADVPRATTRALAGAYIAPFLAFARGDARAMCNDYTADAARQLAQTAARLQRTSSDTSCPAAVARILSGFGGGGRSANETVERQFLGRRVVVTDIRQAGANARAGVTAPGRGRPGKVVHFNWIAGHWRLADAPRLAGRTASACPAGPMSCSNSAVIWIN